MADYPAHPLIHLGRLKIHKVLLNLNVDARILVKGSCAVTVNLFDVRVSNDLERSWRVG